MGSLNVEVPWLSACCLLFSVIERFVSGLVWYTDTDAYDNGGKRQPYLSPPEQSSRPFRFQLNKGRVDVVRFEKKERELRLRLLEQKREWARKKRKACGAGLAALRLSSSSSCESLLENSYMTAWNADVIQYYLFRLQGITRGIGGRFHFYERALERLPVSLCTGWELVESCGVHTQH